jgi:hydroxypyruvate isomerase
MNYHAIATALSDMGYSGPVGYEGFAKGDPDIALEAFRSAFTV